MSNNSATDFARASYYWQAEAEKLRLQLADRDAQIAELKAQLAAQQEVIERLLAEAAHS